MCNISLPSNGTGSHRLGLGERDRKFLVERGVREEQAHTGPQEDPTAQAIWTGRSVPMSIFVFSINKSFNKHVHSLSLPGPVPTQQGVQR